MVVNKKFFPLLFFLSLFFLLVFFKMKFSPQVKKIIVGPQEILVEIAKTPEQREKGLSGRDFLPEGRGMLFLFEKPDYYSFWMKGMKFPLDFVWIRDEMVVEITQNVKPEDFQPPKVLRPKIPVDKVLEIKGGMAKKWGIKEGDKIR